MPTFRVVTCSKGKPDTISVTDWYGRFKDYTVVLCHDADEAAYRNRVKGEIVKCPADCRTLTHKKKWMIENLVGKGEWLLSIDDNVKGITNRAGTEITPAAFFAAVEKDIVSAKTIGAVHGGFASNGNAYFRKKQYRQVGFVWGKVSYFQNAGLPWLDGIREMDDYAATAEALLHHGTVLINNEFYANAARYEKIGGTGPYEQRVPSKREAVEIIMAAFPELYRVQDRPGLAPGTEIRMRYHDIEQIRQWRARMLKR